MSHNIGFKTVLQAWATGKVRKLKNDSIDRTPASEGTFHNLRYHGNTIAQFCTEEPNIVRFTLAGWGTPTTRARLNALLDFYNVKARFHQRKHAQYFNDKECDPHEVFAFDVNTSQLV